MQSKRILSLKHLLGLIGLGLAVVSFVFLQDETKLLNVYQLRMGEESRHLRKGNETAKDLLDPILRDVLERVIDAIDLSKSPPHEIVQGLASQEITTWQAFVTMDKDTMSSMTNLGGKKLSRHSALMIRRLHKLTSSIMNEGTSYAEIPPLLTAEMFTNYLLHGTANFTTSHRNDLRAVDTATVTTTSNLEELRAFYTERVESEVRWNNWNMGCAELSVLGPYLRSILDRIDSGKSSRRRRLLLDVGANNGQDAEAIMGFFHKTVGMCNGLSTPFTVISIEPSPKVFCELKDVIAKRQWGSPDQEIISLNIGMSNETGFLRFRDPGDEGGKLLGPALSKDNQPLELPLPMSQEDFDLATRCSHEGNHTIDYSRVTIVPTYTVDALVSSLELLGGVPLVGNGDEVFLLKVDAEGHDKHVLKGADTLLQEKRIVFVIFEVWNNSHVREITEFMDRHEYACFLISPKLLIPVHPHNWWYDHMNTDVEKGWWGNGICGIRNSPSLSMLFRMYHSDDEFLWNAHDHVVH